MTKVNGKGSALTEQEIVEKITKNEKDVFGILYKKYNRQLLNYASTYVTDHSLREEIVQALFASLCVRNTPLRITSSLSSYLYVALRNRIYNHLRDQAVYKKHVTLAGKKWIRSNNNVEQSINLMELQREINFSLNNMSEKYKQVYLLHEQDHYTVKRISQLLNRPVDTVEKQLRKAVYLLRDHLRENKLHN